MSDHVQAGQRAADGAAVQRHAFASAAHERRAARFALGVALAQLLFLAWPLHVLAEHSPQARGIPVMLAALAFSAALYGWASWRICLRGEAWPAWVGAGLLTGLGVALPLMYGPVVYGLPLYAAVLLGLGLPDLRGFLAVLLVAAITTATGFLVDAPLAQTVSISLLTGLLGADVVAVSRLLATTRELLAARAEIARLAASEERLRLARDLHDAVKQQVFVAAMEVGAARALSEREPPGEAAAAHLAEADGAIRQAQRELSGIIGELRPPATSGRPLPDALRDQVASWSRRHHIAADLQILDGQPVPASVGDALFRAAQEALANVARHSGAQRVQVILAGDDQTVTLTVVDDGHGFLDRDTPPGHGLAGMRERLQALGGSVTVEGKPGAGTRVTCASPRRPR